MEAKTGLKHLTNPENHETREFPVFVILFIDLCLFDRRGGTDLLKIPVFNILVKKDPADIKQIRPHFPRFINRSPGLVQPTWLVKR